MTSRKKNTSSNISKIDQIYYQIILTFSNTKKKLFFFKYFYFQRINLKESLLNHNAFLEGNAQL